MKVRLLSYTKDAEKLCQHNFARRELADRLEFGPAVREYLQALDGAARGARAPRTNAAYWFAKIARNRARDEATLQTLAAQGWRTLVIRECELKHIDALRSRLGAALA